MIDTSENIYEEYNPLILYKIKQIENAMKQWRLSDAAELLHEPSVRAHAKGQALVVELEAALHDRARLCLDAGDFEQGLADCVAGNKLGIKMASIEAELKQGLRDKKTSQKRGMGRIAAAMGEVKKGFLSRGQGMVDDVNSGREKEQVEGVIEEARFEADDAFQQAKAAANRGELVEGLKGLAICMAKHKNKPGLDDLREWLIRESLASGRGMIEGGDLSGLTILLEKLEAVSGEHLEVRGMKGLLGEVKEVEGLVLGQNLREAYMVLKRMQRAWPCAVWIGEAAEDARQAADGIEKIRCSPVFGLGNIKFESTGCEKVNNETGAMERVTRLSRYGDGGAVGNKLDQFVLRIDGLGAFWVIQKELVTVGLGSQGCDIGLQGQKGLPSLKLMREDEDYWVDCGQGVRINKQEVTRKVLSDSDKVVMGSRQGFVFRQPSGASSTAVLDFSQVRLKMVEVKRVVLMDGVVLIGQGSDCHLRCDELGRRVMLMAGRDGYVIKVDGEVTALNFGQAVTVGGGDRRLRLMIEKVPTGF